MERNPGKAATRARNQAEPDPKREKGERADLDSCYGRIGIPAVAAALTPRHDERRPIGDRRDMPWDRD